MKKEGRVEDLIRARGALLTGHFLLSSGMHSDHYVQCARLFEDPKDTERLAKELAKGAPDADLIVSPALGGILIGYDVARALKLRFLFTERSDGAMTLRRGFHIKSGERVIIVEDVLTTGKSTLEVIDVVRKQGGIPTGVLSVINRGCNPATFQVPAKSLLALSLMISAPADCPQCRQGVPIDKPGSRPVAATRPSKGDSHADL